MAITTTIIMTALLGYLLCIMMQVFFIIPCIDIYEKIDLRTQTYDVPPQEVEKTFNDIMLQMIMNGMGAGCGPECQHTHVEDHQ